MSASAGKTAIPQLQPFNYASTKTNKKASRETDWLFE